MASTSCIGAALSDHPERSRGMPTPHDLEQAHDMHDWGFLVDAVTEIEHMRAAGEAVEDSCRRAIELFAACEQEQRIEIALDRHSGRQLARGPGRIDRLVDADRVD